MKKNILFFLLVLGFLYASGQTIRIKDKTDYNDLQSVTLKGTQTGTTLITDRKGEVDISSLKNDDSIVVSIVGYKEQYFSYTKLSALKIPLVLNSEIYEIDEVVISATKFEEKKDKIPQQSEVIDAKELKFMNQQTTADVIQNSGYALVQKSQAGGGSPIMRGFEANKVLMVIDGVRMNNAIYRGSHLQNIITVDNNMLDKTEMIFGPGSVIYGSDALGGVIHFYTKDPDLADSSGKTILKANTFMRYGSVNNEKTGHVDFNVGFKKIGFLTSVTYSDFDDLRQGNTRNPFYGSWGKDSFYVKRIHEQDSMIVNNDRNLQKRTGYSQIDFMEKILFQQNKNSSHVLNFQYSTSSDINRYDRLTLVSGGNPRFGDWYYGPQKRLFGSYSLNLKGKTALYDQARIVLAYQDIEESRHDRRFQNNTINRRTEKVKVSTLNADFSKNIKKHQLRYGIEAMYNEVNSKAVRENIATGATQPTDTRYPNGGSYMRTLAGYLTHAFEISPKWILSEGIRYSNVELSSKFTDTTFYPFPFTDVKQNNNALNGNIGLVHLPGHDWRIAVLGSTGFRAPNVDDIAKVFESIPGNLVIPNRDLKPEYTYNTELSLSKNFYKRFKIEGTGYYTWYKNVITTETTTYNGSDSIIYNGTLSRVLSSQNKGKAYIYGCSVGALAELNEYLAFHQTINYTYGRIVTDTTDYPLDHIPPVFGKTSFLFKVRKFKGEFFMLYNGWKRLKDYNLVGEDNIVYATSEGTSAWYTLNLRTTYHINKFLAVQFAVDNILDSYYRVFASGISAPGRNFSVTLRGSF
jgi:hemoglobin/transferrin/lactoferrin receptor protein